MQKGKQERIKILSWKAESLNRTPCCETSCFAGFGTRGVCIKFWSGSVKGWKTYMRSEMCLDGRIILRLLLQTRGGKVHIDRAAGQEVIHRSLNWGPYFETRPVYIMLVVDHFLQRVTSPNALVVYCQYHSVKGKYSNFICLSPKLHNLSNWQRR